MRLLLLVPVCLSAAPTFYKDVLPVLEKNCQSCHRAGEAEPLAIGAGARIECSARFDNSPNNKFNPDAAKEVRLGDQSWEEIMVGTVDVAIDAKMNPMDLYRPKQRTAAE